MKHANSPAVFTLRVKILLGLALGMAVAVGIYCYRYIPPTAMAQDGVTAEFPDVKTYVAVRTLEERLALNGTATQADFDQLKAQAVDAEPRIQMRALTALYSITNEPYKAQAISVARKRLDDKDAGVRQYALSALAHLRAGDVLEVAQKMLADPAENVRMKAQQLLASR